MPQIIISDMEYPNQQPLKGLINADIETFEWLYKEYYGLLCLIAEHSIRNSEDAEEIVSDVFIKLWNNRNTIHTIHSIKAYLIKALQNTAINYIEKQKSIHSVTDSIDQFHYELLTWDKDYPLGQLYEKEIIGILNREINSLPKGCREIFILSRNEDMSYSDIALKLGISVNTVKSQMKIALSRLREILKDYLNILLLMIGL